MQHRLDVLAGTEQVRREVGAVAAVVVGVERAQHHLIGARGGRRDPVLAEDSLPRTGRPPDLEQLGGPAGHAALPLRVPGQGRRLGILCVRGARLTEQEEPERRRMPTLPRAASARWVETVLGARFSRLKCFVAPVAPPCLRTTPKEQAATAALAFLDVGVPCPRSLSRTLPTPRSV
jgi:hypothetical protein